MINKSVQKYTEYSIIFKLKNEREKLKDGIVETEKQKGNVKVFVELCLCFNKILKALSPLAMKNAILTNHPKYPSLLFLD